jgi:L-cystine transport system substrate-binding protein
MKDFGKLSRSLLASTLLVSGLTGCSSSSSSTASSETKGETINVAVGNSMAPFAYLDADGNLIGYDVDVLNAIDEYLDDYNFVLNGMDFSTCVVSIDSGAADMVSHQLVQSEERKEKYIFPDQYYCLSPMRLVVKKGSNIKSLEDMAGKSLYMNPASYEYGLLTSYNESHPGKEIVINAVSDMTTADCYKAVANGTVDAELTYQSTYESIVDEIGLADELETTEVVLVEDTYQMISKDKPELAEAVSEALKSLLDDGTLGEISTKWFGSDYFEEYADMISDDVE